MIWALALCATGSAWAQTNEPVILSRPDHDAEPTFVVKGERTPVASVVTFLGQAISQTPLHVNELIMLSVKPTKQVQELLKGPLQARMFRLDATGNLPRPWGRAHPNDTAKAAGVTTDCLIFLTLVLPVKQSTAGGDLEIGLGKMDGYTWLTPIPAQGVFGPARYLLVFETQDDNNSIFRVEEGPQVAKYFEQGGIMTVVPANTFGWPNTAFVQDVANQIKAALDDQIKRASRTGASVECKAIGQPRPTAAADGGVTVTLDSCGDRAGDVIDMTPSS